MSALLAELKWNAPSRSASAAITHRTRYSRLIFQSDTSDYFHERPSLPALFTRPRISALSACSDRSAAADAGRLENTTPCFVLLPVWDPLFSCVWSLRSKMGSGDVDEKHENPPSLLVSSAALRTCLTQSRSKCNQYHSQRCFRLPAHDLTRFRHGESGEI